MDNVYLKVKTSAKIKNLKNIHVSNFQEYLFTMLIMKLDIFVNLLKDINR